MPMLQSGYGGWLMSSFDDELLTSWSYVSCIPGINCDKYDKKNTVPCKKCRKIMGGVVAIWTPGPCGVGNNLFNAKYKNCGKYIYIPRIYWICDLCQ